MHDAVQFESLGVPATIVITEPFQGLAASFGVNLGAPGYHTAAVPHPISSKAEAHLEALAESLVDTVAAQLIGEVAAAR